MYIFCNICSAVKGKTPQVGDRVLVEATYNPNMPFKWNAQRIQTLPNQVCVVPQCHWQWLLWLELAPDSLCLLSEPEPGTAAAEDATSRPAAHCPADLRGPGTATATVPAAGTDLSSFHHTSAPDTASATAAAATAERCSFGARLFGGSLCCLLGGGCFLVSQKVEVIAEKIWRGLRLNIFLQSTLPAVAQKSPG